MYFGVRKCATHFVSLGLFCGLVPLTMFTPEVHVPTWALVHLPVAVTLSTAAFTPRGWVYSILFVLFENAMGPVKLWAVINGERPVGCAVGLKTYVVVLVCYELSRPAGLQPQPEQPHRPDLCAAASLAPPALAYRPDGPAARPGVGGHHQAGVVR